MAINDQDRELVESLKTRKILLPVEGHRLDLSRGIIMVSCPDCDQRPDMFKFKEDVFRDRGLDPRIHPLLLNGGALLIPEESPLNDEDKEDRVLLKQIRQTRELKGINTVALYTHMPCGAAGLAKLSSEEVIDFLMLGKLRVRQEVIGSKVACFLHVDKGEKKKTYFVSLEAWWSWFIERKPGYPAIGRRFDATSNESKEEASAS